VRGKKGKGGKDHGNGMYQVRRNKNNKLKGYTKENNKIKTGYKKTLRIRLIRIFIGYTVKGAKCIITTCNWVDDDKLL